MPFRIPHTCKLLLFCTLSAADLLLTWWLVQGMHGTVYESNPIASWWLAHYGWLGLTAFKLGAVALVFGLCGIISCYRPDAAGLVLTFGCGILAVVVLYSSTVAGCAAGQTGLSGTSPLHEDEEAKAQRLEKELSECQSYMVLLKQLSREVVERRCMLAEAATSLADFEDGARSTRLRGLRSYYPSYTDEECLAANLLQQAVASELADSQKAKEVAQRLQEVFVATYGKPAPVLDSSP